MSHFSLSLGLPGLRVLYLTTLSPQFYSEAHTLLHLSWALFPKRRLCSLSSVPGSSLLGETALLITDTGTM